MSLQLSEDRENTFPFRSDDSANTDYSCRMPNGSPRDYIWKPAGLHLEAGGITLGGRHTEREKAGSPVRNPAINISGKKIVDGEGLLSTASSSL